jgi:hypothetical protein
MLEVEDIRIQVMTNFLAEQTEPIEDATQGEQGRPTRGRQAPCPPGLRRHRPSAVPGGFAVGQNPPCSAVLMLAGRQYQCDLPTDAHGRHDGWKHSSKAAEAIWCDDATTELGDEPALPLTLKDIGDLHGAIGRGETAVQYWKGRAGAAETALVKAVEQLRRHQTTSDYEQGYEHGAASAIKAYMQVQAERNELRAKIARIEMLAHLFDTVPSRRLTDVLTSDTRDVPKGPTQPELE